MNRHHVDFDDIRLHYVDAGDGPRWVIHERPAEASRSVREFIGN